jgi:hypothetical protein
MKKLVFIIVAFLFNNILLFSQIAINTNGSSTDRSVMLDEQMTSQGVLLPRMTVEQSNTILNPLSEFCRE